MILRGTIEEGTEIEDYVTKRNSRPKDSFFCANHPW